MIAHVVGLKFIPELTEDEIRRHFETEVVLHERMPEVRCCHSNALRRQR